jgi:hypothetical protein
MTSAQYDAVEGREPAPASRVAVFATASMIVGVLTAVLPLINPEVPARAMLVLGVPPAFVAARLWWASRVGAIRERIIRYGGRLPRSPAAFGLAVINPQVFTREHDPHGFRNYMRFEMALATVVWMMTVMPAFMPLLRRLGDLLGFSAD